MRWPRLRAPLAVLALVAFLAANWAAAVHETGGCPDGDLAACMHGGSAAPGAPATPPKAPPHDHGKCALCRVAGLVSASAPLPAPLPLPTCILAPAALRPADAPRPVVARLSLARGPPVVAPA